jgi:hypothetical protein
MAEPPYLAIWELIKEGRVIPFLGAGASIGAHAGVGGSEWTPTILDLLPSGKELANYFAKYSNFPSENEHDRNDLAKVTSYCSDTIGRDRLDEKLHHFLHHDYPVCEVHRFLAEVPAHQVIVVTNYDTLLEQAFRAAGKPYHLVVYSTNCKEHANALLCWPHNGEPRFVEPNKLDIDLGNTTVIYKMHGTVDKNDCGRDSFVITEEDYVEFLSRMTTQKAVPALLSRCFRDRNFLFLGYSLGDWNLRVILKNIAKMRPAKSILGDDLLPAWAIQKNPTELECRLWEKRGVNIFNITVGEFIAKLKAASMET